MQTMKWDDLKFVLAVGRSGSLSAAGRNLRVDATTVGRRVAAIEAEIGARLFDRTAAGFVATDAGHQAIEHAVAMENTVLALSHQIEGSDQSIEGRLRLTGLDAIFDILVIPELPRLLTRHPGLEITIASNLDFADLSPREADIAVRNRQPVHPDSVGRRIGEMAQAAYAAKGAVFGDAPPLIDLPRDIGDTDYSCWLRDLFPGGHVAARGNTEGHIHALTRAGIGIGVLDCIVGDADQALGRVLPDPISSHIVWAEAHIAMARAPRVRAVIDFLAETFAQNADRLLGTGAPSQAQLAPQDHE